MDRFVIRSSNAMVTATAAASTSVLHTSARDNTSPQAHAPLSVKTSDSHTQSAAYVATGAVKRQGILFPLLTRRRLTAEQAAFVDARLAPGTILCLQAVAGSGKTKTVIERVKALASTQTPVLATAFNKSAVTTLRGALKALSCACAQTTYGLARAWCRAAPADSPFAAAVSRPGTDTNKADAFASPHAHAAEPGSPCVGTGTARRVHEEWLWQRWLECPVERAPITKEDFIGVLTGVREGRWPQPPAPGSVPADIIQWVWQRHARHIPLIDRHGDWARMALAHCMHDALARQSSRMHGQAICSDVAGCALVGRAHWLPRYAMVIVDEAQDCTWTDLVILKGMAHCMGAQICFVGDPLQSLYAFRHCVNAFAGPILSWFACRAPSTLPLTGTSDASVAVEENGLPVTRMTLSQSFRLPPAIVQYVREQIPGLHMHSARTAWADGHGDARLDSPVPYDGRVYDVTLLMPRKHGAMQAATTVHAPTPVAVAALVAVLPGHDTAGRDDSIDTLVGADNVIGRTRVRTARTWMVLAAKNVSLVQLLLWWFAHRILPAYERSTSAIDEDAEVEDCEDGEADACAHSCVEGHAAPVRPAAARKRGLPSVHVSSSLMAVLKAAAGHLATEGENAGADAGECVGTAADKGEAQQCDTFPASPSDTGTDEEDAQAKQACVFALRVFHAHMQRRGDSILLDSSDMASCASTARWLLQQVTTAPVPTASACTSGAILFTTPYSGKGLESEGAIILSDVQQTFGVEGPDACIEVSTCSPRRSHELGSCIEENVRYVAYTRASEVLIVVHEP